MAGILRPLAFMQRVFRPCFDNSAVMTTKLGFPERTIHTSPSHLNEPTSHKIDVGDLKIHYDRIGHGNQILLLMPGALGSSKTDFKYQIENINKDLFTLIAWDPPGYGQSRPPNREWPLHWLQRDADVAARMMKVPKFHMACNTTWCVGGELWEMTSHDLQFSRESHMDGPQLFLIDKKYTLCGWSDGGTTALLLALRYPECVDKLIIWGSASYVCDKDCTANESVRNVEDWSPRMRSPFEAVYGPEYFKKLMSDWVDAYNRYAEINNGDICKNDLHKIKCPTLIIHGQKDALVDQFHPDHIHKGIPHSKYILMKDGKHNLHMKYYKYFNSLVEQFAINPEQVESKL